MSLVVVIHVHVDVIVPVHNAAPTVEEAVRSAMHQVTAPPALSQLDPAMPSTTEYQWSVAVCCYDDGSNDDSWTILQRLATEYSQDKDCTIQHASKSSLYEIPSQLRIAQSKDGCSRGAGFARNRAVDLGGPNLDNHHQQAIRPAEQCHSFLCFLDSDDRMHPKRVYEQAMWFLSRVDDDHNNHSKSYQTLLGCTFDRDPPDATWHYATWANGLSDAQLYLQQFREMTVLQPTWMISRPWFLQLGGYMEAPPPSSSSSAVEPATTLTPGDATTKTVPMDTHSDPHGQEMKKKKWSMVHPLHDSPSSLRLAEDLRFFYTHLNAGGALALLRTPTPLVTYRHGGSATCWQHHTNKNKNNKTDETAVSSSPPKSVSQSSQTSRRLLLQLRVWALEHLVLQRPPQEPPIQNGVAPAVSPNPLQQWSSFCVWGAGRDAKEVLKALSPELRSRVACLADVDVHKLSTGYYVNRHWGCKIPIVHFSLLARDAQVRHELQHEFQWQQQQQDEKQEPQLSSCTGGDGTGSNRIGGTSSNADRRVGPVSSSFGRIRKGKPTLEHKHPHGETTEKNFQSPHPLLPSKDDDDDTNKDSNSQERNVRDVRPRQKKRRRVHSASLLHAKDLNPLLIQSFPQLPVIVCVAMYRTGGALEHNVKLIGRTEGYDLWHVV